MEFSSYINLNLVADFWRKNYANASKIEGSLQAQDQLIKTQYFSYLQRVLPPSIRNVPIFKEVFWEALIFNQSDRHFWNIYNKEVSEVSSVSVAYKINYNTYASIPYIYNVIFNPTLILTEGTKEEVLNKVTVLDVGEKYYNDSDSSITHNTKTYPPNSYFIAETTTFTFTQLLVIGGVYLAKDYYIVRTPTSDDTDSNQVNIDNYIVFRKSRDPYFLESVAVRYNTDNTKRISMFAPNALVDMQDIYKMFGALIGTKAISSEEYKNFVEGVYYLYFNGPTIQALNVALNVSHGYPVAREDEVIVKVYVYDTEFLLVSDRMNTYSIRRKEVTRHTILNDSLVSYQSVIPRLILSNKQLKDRLGNNRVNADFSDPVAAPVNENAYDVYWPMTAFSTFLEDLRVMDYITEPKWWLKYLEEVPPQLTNMPDELRSDREVLDYVFEELLKINTLGILISSEIMVNFSGVIDYYKILQNCKPKYKTFVTIYRDINPVSIIDIDIQDSVTVGIGDDVVKRTELKYYIRIMSIHDIEMYVGMDKTGFISSDVNQVDNCYIGIAVDTIGASYDILNLSYYIKALDNLGNIYPGAIKSQIDLGFAFGDDIGMDFPLGSLPTEGLRHEVALYKYFNTGYEYLLVDDSGNILNDNLYNNNDGYIEQSSETIAYEYTLDGSPENDVPEIISNTDTASYEYLLDNSVNNDSGILENVPEVLDVNYEYLIQEGFGNTLIDNYGNNNGEIE